MKKGIQVHIPGFGVVDIKTIVSDYTGTHSCGGALTAGVREALSKLSESVDIHILTSDTFGTCREELSGLDVIIHILDGSKHDAQKAAYVENIGAKHVAAFGNGNNDRLMLKAVKDAGGLAVAVDNGEGCATDAILSSNVFVHGSIEALNIMLDTRRLTATLRF